MMKDYEDFTLDGMWNVSNTSMLCSNHSCIPNDEKDELRYQISLLRYYLIGICGMTICCLGIVGNIMSVIILTRRVMRSSTYSYLTALALSDTFFLLFTLLIARQDINEPKLGDLDNYPDNFYARTFWFVHACAITFQVTSIWLTLAFTVDRYIMICHPFRAERWCSIKRARWVIFGLVVGGIVFNFIRFFEYTTKRTEFPILTPDMQMFNMSSFNTSDVNETHAEIGMSYFSFSTLETRDTIMYTRLGESTLFKKIVHSWFYLTCVAGIPFIALFTLNTFLMIAVHNSRKKGKMINAKEKRRNDTTVMLIGVIVIFLICEGPALIARMIYALGHDKLLHLWSYNLFSEVANLLVTLNSAINIVPYYFFGKKFRQQFWRVFCSCVLTKEEIRKITRSLSVSMDRRFSNAGPNGHEMNNIALFETKKEDSKVYKNSIAVPLILNIEERTSFDTNNPFLMAHQNSYVMDDSPTDSEVTSDQKKVLVSLEANGNCEIMLDSPCSDCQNTCKTIL